MALTLTFTKIPLKPGVILPPTVSLYYKEYYSATYILIDTAVNIDDSGNILDSPLPTISINPAEKYMLKVLNEMCGIEYEQPVIIYPYCPVGYTLADDESYCYILEETEATPPTGSENAVSQTSIGYNPYGALIFNLGFNSNGTGTATQISYGNTFWVNGSGYPSTTGTLIDGVMNRGGIWSNTVFVGQQVGFSTCITVATDGIYYVGISCDDKALIQIDGQTIVDLDRAALGTYFRANGYPLAVDAQMGYNFFYIYPVFLTSGVHVVEMIGVNTQGILPGNASLVCEVYDLTSAEIQAATSYVDLGVGLLFSSKDYIGQPIQIGSGGTGYECPAGYSLQTCSSPYICRRIITTPILY